MPDNIYDVKVGDKLTPEQMREAAGVGANQGEPVAEYSATDEQNPEATDAPEEQKEQMFFMWPENLKGDYPVRIMFTAYKLEAAQDELIESSKRKIEEIREKGLGTYLQETAVETAVGASNVLSDIVTRPGEVAEDVFEGFSETVTSIGNMNTYDNFQGGEAVGTVMLPLMRGVQYTDGVNYTQGNTQTGAGIIRALTPDGADENGRITEATAGLASQLAARVAGTAVGAAVGGIIGAGAGFMITEGVGNALKESTRVTLNPNLRSIFEGVNMRSFSFPFRMIAKSEKESQEIKKIIQFFRREVYPEANNVDGTVPYAYTFPNIFEINILDGKQKNPGFDIQRCYLQSVQTNFNQTSTGMYEGKDRNYFIEVDLTLNFIEFATLDKNRVREGNY
jgi:hypothetical protein